MVQKSDRTSASEYASFLLLLAGIVVAGIILLLLVRSSSSLLGPVLAAIAVALLAYWVREVRNSFRKILPGANQESSKRDFVYELIEDGEGLTLVAEVPGHPEKVEVEMTQEGLKIRGGLEFYRVLNLHSGGTIGRTTYVNGILSVRLSKK